MVKCSGLHLCKWQGINRVQAVERHGPVGQKDRCVVCSSLQGFGCGFDAVVKVFVESIPAICNTPESKFIGQVKCGPLPLDSYTFFGLVFLQKCSMSRWRPPVWRPGWAKEYGKVSFQNSTTLSMGEVSISELFSDLTDSSENFLGELWYKYVGWETFMLNSIHVVLNASVWLARTTPSKAHSLRWSGIGGSPLRSGRPPSADWHRDPRLDASGKERTLGNCSSPLISIRRQSVNSKLTQINISFAINRALAESGSCLVYRNIEKEEHAIAAPDRSNYLPGNPSHTAPKSTHFGSRSHGICVSLQPADQTKPTHQHQFLLPLGH